MLVQLLQTDRAPTFLQTLISMDLTLHSMEVVNRLTALPEMPPDFLHLYISHCLSSCAQAKVWTPDCAAARFLFFWHALYQDIGT